jgi:CHASE2 domain-containing sensor protein
LIGNDRPYIDRHRTPFSAKSGDEMLGVMVHAHITAQLLDVAAMQNSTTGGRLF